MNKFITRGIYMTCGIQGDIKREELSREDIQSCLDRHFQNKGDECLQDKGYNHYAIKHKEGRVFSVFNDVKGKKIYIITDGLHLADDPEHGRTYPMTTILYPEEY